MSSTPRVPPYPKNPHRHSGQARIKLSGKTIYLGQHGSPESKEKYDREIAEWLAHGRGVVPAKRNGTLSVQDALAAYLEFAKTHYVKNGKATRQLRRIRECIGITNSLYGNLPADDFSPLKLQVVRNEMIRKGWARTYVNACVAIVVRCWGWFVSQEMTPVTVYQALLAVCELLHLCRFFLP